MTTAIETIDAQCQALAALGAAVAPSATELAGLRAALGAPASRVRAAAARALGALLARDVTLRGLGAEIARGLAEVALSDPHLWARQAAAGALAHAPGEALGCLDDALRGGEPEARERAARALGHWGRGSAAAPAVSAPRESTPRAELAERALAAALGDESPRVRAAAAEALGTLPALGAAVEPLAARARGDADPTVRVAALGALGDAGAVDHDAAFGAIEAALGDEVTEAVVAALEATLASRRPDRAARLLVALRGLARSRPEEVRVAALRALASLGGGAAAAIDDVLAAASHRSWAVREQAVEAFVELAAGDPAIAEARLPALIASSWSGDRYVGLRVLHRIGALPEGLAPAVWAIALEDHDVRTRDLARELLGHALAPGAALSERLLASLRGARPSARARAATIARELGPAASSLVPALVGALPDPSRAVRRAAVEALGAVGAAALPGVPPALRRAFEGELGVTQAAKAALKALSPELAPELRAKLATIVDRGASEELLLGMLDGGLPTRVEAELERAARNRARWHASLFPAAAAPPDEASADPGGGARGAALAALDAAGAAAGRRRRPDSGPGARRREVVWLLAFAVRELMAKAP